MPLQIRCPCQQILSVDESQQGRVVSCPFCGTQLTVPVMQQQPQYPAAPGYPAPGPAFAPQGAGFPAPPNFPGSVPGYPGPGTNVPQAPGGYPGPGFPGGAPNLPGQQPGMPNFPGAPGFSGAPNFPAPGAPYGGPALGPAGAPNFDAGAKGGSNPPSMPFLSMQAPAASGPSLNDLTRGQPNVPGGWKEPTPQQEPEIWHIPCPNGHVLETPDDMLDQDVLCPYCETQFTLKHINSVEATEKRARDLEARDQRAADLWLKWAIGIAVVVILGVIIMIAVSASQ